MGDVQAQGQVIDQDEVDSRLERGLQLFSRGTRRANEVHAQPCAVSAFREGGLQGPAKVVELDEVGARGNGVLHVGGAGLLPREITDADVGLKRPSRARRFVSTRDDGLVEATGFDDAAGHALGERLMALDLDIDPDVVGEDVEGLGQGGDALAPEALAPPATRVEATKLGEGVIGHPSAAVGRAIDGGIVNDDDLAVRGAPHVELNLMDTEGGRLTKGREGVLRPPGGATAVCADPAQGQGFASRHWQTS